MKALLIRHATSSGQAPEAPLTPEGYAEAQALVSTLVAFRAGPLYASPYRRAVETITPYAEATAQKVTELEGLRERLLSPTPLDDWQDHIRRSFTDPSHAPDGGESHRAMLRRITPALLQIENTGGALPALVTHGGMTSALFNAVNPSFGFDSWQGLRNPDLFMVTIEDGTLTHFERQEITP